MNSTVAKIGGTLLGACAFFAIETAVTAATVQDSPWRWLGFVGALAAFVLLTTVGVKIGRNA